MISLDKPQIICHAEQQVTCTLYDVKWLPCSARFVSIGGHTNGAGSVQLWALNQGKLDKLSEFSTGQSLKCGTFNASSLRERHLATGDFKGRLQIWDLERPMTALQTYTTHQSIINAMDGVAGASVGCGAPELVTGSRDGRALVWDARQPRQPVASMEPGDEAQGRDCWAVAFGNSYNCSERCVAAGYDNGDVKLLDLRMNRVRWEANVRNGVCAVQFDRADIPLNKLVVTTLEDHIHVYDLRTQHPSRGFARLTERGHKATVWFAKHLPQNREVFITAGGAGTLCLWKYEYPERRVEKDSDGVSFGVAGTLQPLQNYTLSTQPINALDWNADKLGLAVCCSFDQTLRVLVTTKLNLL